MVSQQEWILPDFETEPIQALSNAILALLPQRPPFRFLDTILEINEDHIIGEHTFHSSEPFYAGHFPGNPITPGVLLLETIAQTSVVAFGIYQVMLARHRDPHSEHRQYLTAFTEVEAQFLLPVPPGETVTVRGEKLFVRHRKLKSKAELLLSSGRVAVSAVLSGVGIKES